MNNFTVKESFDKLSTGEFKNYPPELENSWIIFHKIDDHHQYAYMLCMYKNSDLPTGTIVESPYYYHRYPDVHSTYNHKDKITGKNFGVTGWVNPKYRRRGFWFWYSVFVWTILWNNFNIRIDAGGDRDKKMENFYNKVTKTIKQDSQTKNNGMKNFNLSDDQVQRDTSYPYTWYNHRIGGKVETEKESEE